MSCLVLALCVSCASQPGRQGGHARGREAVEISQASLSRDGTTIALETLESADDDWPPFVRVSFLDLASRQIVAWTPPGCYLPEWGPENSYVMRTLRPGQTTELFWAPAASADAARFGVGEKDWVVVDAMLAPDLASAVLAVWSARGADGQWMHRIVTLPLPGGKIDTVWSGPFEVQLGGVFSDPEEARAAVVVFVSPSHTPGSRSVLQGVSHPGGRERWRGELGDQLGLLRGSSAYRSGEALIVEEPVAASEDTDNSDPQVWAVDYRSGGVCARIWHLDLATGATREFARIPSVLRALTVLHPPGREPLVVFGGFHDVWWISGEGGAAAQLVIRGSASTTPAGAKLGPSGEIEVYMATRHCLWRCRLKTGEVETIWGEPADGDDPPKIVGSTG